MAVLQTKAKQATKSADKVKGARIQKPKIKRKQPSKATVKVTGPHAQNNEKAAANASKVPKHENGLLKIVLDDERKKTAKQNSENSPLLRLPFEIRNKIYSYVLGDKDYYVHTNKSKPICAIEEKPRATHRELLSVCTQIYSEAVTLPFQVNTFRCWPHVMYSWLETLLPGQRDAITTIQVNYPETQSGIYYLKDFQGLKRIHVGWTPYHHTDFSFTVQRLRNTTGKPDLIVVFMHED